MRHELMGITIDDVDEIELHQRFTAWLASQTSHVIVTPNAEFLLETRRHRAFLELLNRADLAVADSVSLQFAVAALSRQRLVNRIPGVDLLDHLCDIASHCGMRILLLGGDPGSAEAAGRQLVAKYSALNVDSLDPGNIEWHDGHVSIDEALIRKIQHLHPAIVAVALGHYKQEQFIEQARQPCSSVKIWIGVGGALEMIAGQKRRAPRFWSRKGLEWLWRLFIEPRRWWRIFNASIVFPLVVAREAWRQGTFLRSTKKVFSEIYRQWHV